MFPKFGEKLADNRAQSQGDEFVQAILCDSFFLCNIKILHPKIIPMSQDWFVQIVMYPEALRVP